MFNLAQGIWTIQLALNRCCNKPTARNEEKEGKREGYQFRKKWIRSKMDWKEHLQRMKQNLNMELQF
jgi:hypothetical protein